MTTISADASRLSAATSGGDQSRASETVATSSPFKARIRLERQKLRWEGALLPVVAGMQVQAEIRQGDRTVMEYLMSPVKRVISEAGGER